MGRWRLVGWRGLLKLKVGKLVSGASVGVGVGVSMPFYVCGLCANSLGLDSLSLPLKRMVFEDIGLGSTCSALSFCNKMIYRGDSGWTYR